MNDKEGSQPARSWGRFAGRLYFLGDRNLQRSHQEQNQRKNNLGLYSVAISIVYFFLIAVILIILLLAPKYRMSSPSLPTSSGSDVTVASIINDKAIVDTDPVPAGMQSAENEHHDLSGKDALDHYSYSEETFLPSPKDPLYDIDLDPRSQNIPDENDS